MNIWHIFEKVCIAIAFVVSIAVAYFMFVGQKATISLEIYIGAITTLITAGIAIVIGAQFLNHLSVESRLKQYEAVIKEQKDEIENKLNAQSNVLQDIATKQDAMENTCMQINQDLGAMIRRGILTDDSVQHYCTTASFKHVAEQVIDLLYLSSVKGSKFAIFFAGDIYKLGIALSLEQLTSVSPSNNMDLKNSFITDEHYEKLESIVKDVEKNQAENHQTKTLKGLFESITKIKMHVDKKYEKTN